MTTLITCAIRNLFRHKKRTIVTAIAIALGLSMYIYLDSLLEGINDESFYNLINYETSSLRIYHREYVEERENYPLDKVIENPQQINEFFGEYVLAPRTVFIADLITQEDPYPVDGSFRTLVHAVDPSRDTEVFRTLEEIDFAQPYSAIIGEWVAEDIGAKLGYPLLLVTRTRDGFYQTIDVEIQDIVLTPNPQTNRTVFIPLALADEMLNMEGAVTEINFKLSPLATENDYTLIQDMVNNINPDLTTLSWCTLGEDVVALSESERSSTGIIIFLVFIIIAVGISNTILITVQERRREIGVLRAIGMSKKDIRLLFFYEALGIGILGVLASFVLGILFTALSVYVGIDYTAMLRNIDMGYRITGVMRGVWKPLSFFVSAMLGLTLSPLMSFFPVNNALKQSVVEALRE